MLLNLVEGLEVIKAKAILKRIESRAQKKWGKRWLAELTYKYVEIAKVNGDPDGTFERRRTQIGRYFQTDAGCNADTLLMLAAAVDCKIQFVCLEVEEL